MCTLGGVVKGCIRYIKNFHQEWISTAKIHKMRDFGLILSLVSRYLPTRRDLHILEILETGL